MKFTILTQYYPPETGAPQNRLHSLARQLQRAGHEVDVITAMPNYPMMHVFEGYRGRIYVREQIDGVDVQRTWSYVSPNRQVGARLLNYFSFVVSSLFAGLQTKRRDFLICESPPLFLGISAFLLSRRFRARLIFNVSDLWPESAESLGVINSRLLLQAAYCLEAWLYRRSFIVTGQTRGIVDNIVKRFPSVRAIWLPNGVDIDVYEQVIPDSAWRLDAGCENKKIFIYAGNLGHAQGLEVIIRAARLLRERNELGFVIVGDGPCAGELKALNKKLDAGVFFLPTMEKHRVLRIVADAYAYIVVLKNLSLFRGAIPSKLFDPLACGVPILLGVDGEARELFIERGNAGLYFIPENEEALVEVVLRIAEQRELRDRLGSHGRAYVEQYFDRRKIANAFFAELCDEQSGKYPVTAPVL